MIPTCARSPRTARRILLWSLLGFAGVQLALAVGMECLGPQVRDPELGVKLAYLRSHLAEQPDRPLVLMLGSSRTLQGFRADRLEEAASDHGTPLAAFNFGLTGAGPLKLWTCFRRLLDEQVRPQLLLVEVLPPLLNEPGPARMSEENWLAVPHLMGADVLRLSGYYSRPASMYRTWARSLLVPAYAHRERPQFLWLNGGEPYHAYADILAPMDRWGWQPLARSNLTREQREVLTARAERQYDGAFHDFRVGTGARRALGDLLACCRRRRINVALVLMPEGVVFRSRYSASMREALDTFLTELSQTFGAGLIDARDWIDDADFYDSHHLLPGGAARFTDRLACVVADLARKEGVQ
jgi:hypothetical protein